MEGKFNEYLPTYLLFQKSYGIALQKHFYPVLET